MTRHVKVVVPATGVAMTATEVVAYALSGMVVSGCAHPEDARRAASMAIDALDEAGWIVRQRDEWNRALGERDHYRFSHERLMSLREEIAIALGVDHLKGEQQYKAALAAIERLKAVATQNLERDHPLFEVEASVFVGGQS